VNRRERGGGPFRGGGHGVREDAPIFAALVPVVGLRILSAATLLAPLFWFVFFEAGAESFRKVFSSTFIAFAIWRLETLGCCSLIIFAICARCSTAKALVASGVSQRKAAKMLGVTETTVRRDVRRNDAKSASEKRTGSTATKARRAAASARASSEGVTEGGR